MNTNKENPQMLLNHYREQIQNFSDERDIVYTATSIANLYSEYRNPETIIDKTLKQHLVPLEEMFYFIQFMPLEYRFYLYTGLLDKTLFEDGLTGKDREKAARKILNAINKDISRDTHTVNWAGVLPLSFMLKLVTKLKHMGLEGESLLDRWSFKERRENIEIIGGLNLNDQAIYDIWKYILSKSEENTLVKIGKNIAFRGYFGPALEVVEQLSTTKMKCLLISRIAVALYRVNNTNSLPEHPHDRYIYANIQKHGRTHQIAGEQMSVVASKRGWDTSKQDPSLLSYIKDLPKSAAINKLMDEALALASKSSDKILLYSLLALDFNRTGQKGKAEELTETAIEYAYTQLVFKPMDLSEEDLEEKIDNYHYIIISLKNLHLKERAKEILASLIKTAEGIKDPEVVKTDAYIAISYYFYLIDEPEISDKYLKKGLQTAEKEDESINPVFETILQKDLKTFPLYTDYAEKILQIIDEENSYAIILICLMDAFLKTGKTDNAIAYAESFIQKSPNIPVEEKVQLYLKLAQGYYLKGHNHKQKETIKKAVNIATSSESRKKINNLDVYNMLIHQNQHQYAAHYIYEFIKNIVTTEPAKKKSFRSNKPHVMTGLKKQLIMLYSQNKPGATAPVLKILKEVNEEYVEKDWRYKIFLDLSRQLYKRNLNGPADEYMRYASEAITSIRGLNDHIKELCDQGKPDQAHALFNDRYNDFIISYDEDVVEIYTHLSNGFFYRQNFSKADVFMDYAIRLMNQEDSDIQIEHSIYIARALYQQNKTKLALEILEEGYRTYEWGKTTCRNDEDLDKLSGLASSATGLATEFYRQNEPETAWKIGEDIVTLAYAKKLWNFFLVPAVTNMMADTGKSKRGIEILEDLFFKFKPDTAYDLDDIMIGLIDLGEYDRVIELAENTEEHRYKNRMFTYIVENLITRDPHKSLDILMNNIDKPNAQIECINKMIGPMPFAYLSFFREKIKQAKSRDVCVAGYSAIIRKLSTDFNYAEKWLPELMGEVVFNNHLLNETLRLWVVIQKALYPLSYDKKMIHHISQVIQMEDWEKEV